MNASRKLSITPKSLALITIGVLLILVAGLRPIGIDKDSLNYVTLLDVDIVNANFISKEPIFWVINWLNKILFGENAHTFFLMFAIIGVSIKLYVIRKYSITPILSLLTYISMFFILQEMTQIRSGVAIGLVFWALHDLILKKNIAFLTKILIGTLFHYSAIVMFLLYFLSSRKINVYFYLLLPLVGVVLSYTHLPFEILYFIAQILPNFLSAKIHIYFSLMKQGKIDVVNPFNIGNLFILCIYYLNLYIVTKKQRYEMKAGYYLLCIKLLGFGFFILFGFYFIEVFAYRMANYLFFTLVFLIPAIPEYFRQKRFLINLIGIYLIYTLVKNAKLMLNILGM